MNKQTKTIVLTALATTAALMLAGYLKKQYNVMQAKKDNAAPAVQPVAYEMEREIVTA